MKFINQTPCEIEIITKPNPFFYGPVVFLALCIVWFEPKPIRIDGLGIKLFFIVFTGLIIWWLYRPHSVRISFQTKEATFVHSSLNPFTKEKTVSLKGFTRAYAQPFYRGGGWSIHLSGAKGEHLLLAHISSLLSPVADDDEVRVLVQKIASGLGIGNGGIGG